MGYAGDLLVYDYLRVLAESVHGRLRPEERVRFVSDVRRRIEQQRGSGAEDDAQAVRAVLRRLGTPTELITREVGQVRTLSRAQRPAPATAAGTPVRSLTRVTGPGYAGQNAGAHSDPYAGQNASAHSDPYAGQNPVQSQVQLPSRAPAAVPAATTPRRRSRSGHQGRGRRLRAAAPGQPQPVELAKSLFGSTTRWGVLELAAVVLFAASLLISVVGWLPGAVLTVRSRRFRLRDKAVAVGLLPVVAIAGSAAAQVAADWPAQGTPDPDVIQSAVLAVALTPGLSFAGAAAAAYLVTRRRRS